MKTITLTLLLLLAGFVDLLPAQDIHHPVTQNQQDFPSGHDHIPPQISFIENLGQWKSPVRYKTSTGGLNTVFLEDNALTYLFSAPEDVEKIHELMYASDSAFHKLQIHQHAYRVKFLTAEAAVLKGVKKKLEYHNYILGNDPSKWVSYVPLFEKIQYSGLYEGIQLEAYSESGNFKYDFIVNSGSDPNQIKLQYEGADDLELENGNLIIHTSVETIIEQKPYAYQVINGRERKVDCNYVLEGNTVSFEFPEGYDQNEQLIIDPVVVAATLSGTTGNGNFGHTATYDNAGNIYAAGISFGPGYPVNTGAFQITFAGGYSDIAVSKYNPDGSELIYATYIGGFDREYPHSMITDFNQQLHIYGSTWSNDYPVTSNAVQSSHGGNFDIFVTKLNQDGSALLGSTYLGGSNDDGNNTSGLNINYGDAYKGEIILDPQGNAYVASMSSSPDFPVTAEAYDTSFNTIGQAAAPAQDGVVFKLNNDFSSLRWSTFLGEEDSDAALGLRLDDLNNVYVTGIAGSNSFPSTAGTLEPEWMGGEEDAFVVLLSEDGSDLMAGMFWGSDGDEHAYFIDTDESGNVHIFGQTTDTMPVTPDTYVFNNNSRQFLSCFSGDLKSLVYSTVIGTGFVNFGPDFVPVGFMVDKCNYIYFSGYYANYGLPTTPDAISTQGDNFYIGVLEPEATGLSYGTYYGDANHVDGGSSRFDKRGTIYQAVCSCEQPSAGLLNTLPGAYAETQTTFCDIGVFKIDFEVNTVTAAAAALPGSNGTVPFTVDFQYAGQGASNLFWDFDDDGNTSSETNPSYTFNEIGTYRVMQVASNSSTCNLTDTSYILINVNAPVSAHEPVEELEIDIFPNPVSGQLFIKSPYLITEVVLYNSIGQVIMTDHYQGELQPSLNMEKAISGVYFVKVKTAQGLSTGKVIIKTK